MLSFLMKSRWLLVPVLLGWFAAAQATEFSAADYDLYAGDFNNDGKTDLLYIAKSPDKPSGIALADATGTPQLGFQSWPSNFLNIPWSSGAYKAIIGDFNGDHCADILLQSQTAGTSYVLLANCNPANGPVGQIQGISQAIAQTTFGIAWSADQHQIIAGDFDGDGKADLFLQATSASGTSAIVLADTNGHLFTRTSEYCWHLGPQQCWLDGYEGMKWSTQSSLIYAGDFNGDGKTDLLVQAKPTWIMIDYDVPFPVPKFAAQGFGIFLAQTADSSGAIIRSPNQLWSVNDVNGKWSPFNSTVVVGDFNGDGHADVMLQSRSGTNMLMLANASGNGQLQSGSAVAGTGANWTSGSYKIIVGKFGIGSVPSLYLQATTAGGTNYISGNISGTTVTSTASTLQISATVTAPANGVGATVGAADVTPAGAATYTIPLKLSRGTAGLTPQLALQYQHSTKNGLLGVGWSLSGLSVITRCPQTFAQDGVTQGVKYLASDQYCLDGDRLRLTSGTQGADGSQYRTELETYSLVIAHGVGTNGPTSFEVRKKDGQIYEYGNTADSQVSGTAGTRVWALNKIRDRASNYIAFSYYNNSKNPVAGCRESNSQGSYRPCQILYSGNTNQSTSPPYTVQFYYQNRNAGEVLQRWYSGQSITEVNRLLRIELQYAAAVVRKWVLGYDSAVTLSHFSRITTIQECRTSTCFTPTTFGWSTQAASGSLPALSTTSVADPTFINIDTLGYAYPPVSVDLDGDGIPDTVQSNYSAYYTPPTPELTVTWGVAPGQPARPQSFVLGTYATNFGAVDYDGDGKEDVSLSNGYLHQRADGTLAVDPYPSQPTILGATTVLVDVDGDGFKDLVWSPGSDNTHLYFAYHNHDGSPGYESTIHTAWSAPAGTTITGPLVYTSDGYVYPNSQLTSADVDGDGRQDILVQVNNGWRVLYSNGSGFVTGDLIASRVLGTVHDTPVLIDVNGDGCTDVVFVGSTNSNWQLATSKCAVSAGVGLNTAFDTSVAAPTSSAGVNVVDVNSDGYQDLVFPTTGTSGNYVNVALSTGTGFLQPIPNGTAFSLWSDRNGDGMPDRAERTNALYYPAAGPKADLMLSASDAFGNSVSFTYALLTDPTVYTRGSAHVGKTQDMGGSLYMVRQLQSSDGVGGSYSLNYTYANALRNLQGRGFLGFGSRTITDSRTGFVTQETYNNTINAADGTNWELVGTLAESKVQQWSGGPILQDTLNHWTSIAPDGATNRRYPYLQTKTVTSYELGNSGSVIATKVTTTTIDNYGTPYDVVVTTTEGSTGIHGASSHTQEAYTAPANVLNDTANWCLSKPQLTQIKGSHTLTDGVVVTQSVTEVWDAVNCRLTHRNLDVGTLWELDTQFDYDAWNNVWHQYVSATNLPQTQRKTTFDYSTSTSPGQQLMTMTNALGQHTTYTWDDAKALEASETNVGGFTTSWTYDEFGRLAHVIHPDGTGSRRTYSACNVNTNFCGDSLLRYMVQEDQRDIHDNIISYRYEFYDSLNRIKYDESLGYSGALSVVESLYDPRGNLVTRSMPYYAGTDSYKGTSYSYDLYNRLVGAEHPTSDSDATPATTRTVYNGLTVTTIDELLNSRTRVSDAWGDVLQVTDEGGKTTYYTYDGFSNLKSTTDINSNATVFTYTARGLRLSVSDPDLGAWSYTYDGAGEMLTQTDAKNQQSVYHYDALGRPDKRTDPGAGSPDTIWTWDTATNGIGQLASVSGPLGYSEVYGYDGTAGRKVSESVTAVGNTYAVNYGYDPLLGSLQTITYPTSTSGRVEVLYEYQNGFLKDVKDYNNQSTVFWQAIAQDARAHVIQEQFGNGQQTYLAFDETTGRLEGVQTGAAGGSATQNLNYSWDGAGNLLARGDGNQNLRETFQYDPLYRLQTVSLNGSQSLSMSYDSIGNIGSKSDVSSTVGGTNHGYDYTTAQSACSYTGLTSQPHAVRNAGGFVYCYDADGNMTSRTGASVTWYPYNLPQTINQTGGNYSTFYYAPDRSRYRQTSLNASVTEDRIYVGGLFEKLTSSAVGVEYRHYIVANGEKIAVKVVSSTRNDTLYLHRDHLGSTDVVTDQTGAVKVHESHDAWGRRRGSAWTGAPSAADSNTITATTHIGFTGQEELDNLGLVDLNGRVYDPLIARMLSADPYVQAPYRSQSLNRYSYTWNNPLNSTDPSGFACTGSHIADLEPGSAGCEYTSTYPGEGAQFNTPSPAARPGQSDAQPLSAQVTAGPNVNASQGALPAGAAESRALAEVSITASRDPASRSELFLRGLIHVAEVALPGYYFANRAYELARTGHPWWALIYGVASVTDVALTVVTAGAAEGALSAVRGGFVAEAAFAADNAAQAARGVGAIVGGGAKLENLTASEILRIQNAANRTGTKITVVGSRASGTSHALSDWDYVVPEGTANRIIHSIKSSVPEGPRGLGEPRNQDFFKSGVDPTSPFITFTPQ